MKHKATEEERKERGGLVVKAAEKSLGVMLNVDALYANTADGNRVKPLWAVGSILWARHRGHTLTAGGHLAQLVSMGRLVDVSKTTLEAYE